MHLKIIAAALPLYADHTRANFICRFERGEVVMNVGETVQSGSCTMRKVLTCRGLLWADEDTLKFKVD